MKIENLINCRQQFTGQGYASTESILTQDEAKRGADILLQISNLIPQSSTPISGVLEDS